MQDKDRLLENYKVQYEALCQQNIFATDMLEVFSRRITRVEVVTPNFFSLGVVDDLAKSCRQFIKFYELRNRISSDISDIRSEIDIIKNME